MGAKTLSVYLPPFSIRKLACLIAFSAVVANWKNPESVQSPIRRRVDNSEVNSILFCLKSSIRAEHADGWHSSTKFRFPYNLLVG